MTAVNITIYYGVWRYPINRVFVKHANLLLKGNYHEDRRFVNNSDAISYIETLRFMADLSCNVIITLVECNNLEDWQKAYL